MSMASDRRWTAIGAATLAAALAAACEKPAPAPPPPTEVYVTSVAQKDVPVYLDMVGQTVGYQDVEIRARVEGFLQSMDYQEGSFVQKGALLYVIDPKELQAAVSQSKADQATAQARLEKATNDVNRYTPLVAKQAVSRQELDDAKAAQDAARSQVEAAKAGVEKATIDLGYTRVSSPIAGLVGTTLVKPGNLVGRGQNTLLTTVSQIDPMLFRVGLTEADYLKIAKRNQSRAAGAPKVTGIELTLTDGTVHPQTGTVNTVDRAVDPATGTLGVQFAFPNPDHVLRPGQFGRARVLLETKTGALLVPQRAVQELQNLYSVAIIDASNKVAFRNVKVGQRVGSDWVIEDGVKPGERVVVEGLQRIRDGMTVEAKPAPPVPTAAAAVVQTAGEAK